MLFEFVWRDKHTTLTQSQSSESSTLPQIQWRFLSSLTHWPFTSLTCSYLFSFLEYVPPRVCLWSVKLSSPLTSCCKPTGTLCRLWKYCTSVLPWKTAALAGYRGERTELDKWQRDWIITSGVIQIIPVFYVGHTPQRQVEPKWSRLWVEFSIQHFQQQCFYYILFKQTNVLYLDTFVVWSQCVYLLLSIDADAHGPKHQSSHQRSSPQVF